MSIKVLFLSRNNAARSQLAEYLLNQMGRGRFEAVSAGRVPAAVHPLVPEVLAEVGIDASSASSKPIGYFADESFDFIINICDDSTASCKGRRPGCPEHPGQSSHGCWGFGSMPVDDQALSYLRGAREQVTNRLRIWMAAVDKGAAALPCVGEVAQG